MSLIRETKSLLLSVYVSEGESMCNDVRFDCQPTHRLVAGPVQVWTLPWRPGAAQQWTTLRV